MAVSVPATSQPKPSLTIAPQNTNVVKQAMTQIAAGADGISPQTAQANQHEINQMIFALDNQAGPSAVPVDVQYDPNATLNEPGQTVTSGGQTEQLPNGISVGDVGGQPAVIAHLNPSEGVAGAAQALGGAFGTEELLAGRLNFAQAQQVGQLTESVAAQGQPAPAAAASKPAPAASSPAPGPSIADQWYNQYYDGGAGVKTATQTDDAAGHSTTVNGTAGDGTHQTVDSEIAGQQVTQSTTVGAVPAGGGSGTEQVVTDLGGNKIVVTATPNGSGTITINGKRVKSGTDIRFGSGNQDYLNISKSKVQMGVAGAQGGKSSVFQSNVTISPSPLSPAKAGSLDVDGFQENAEALTPGS